jgi:hypothetical protein
MKTHILQLELHDDIISARDKMGWGKSKRILIVWPERGRVLYRRLDLELIRRHSTSQGAQVALVCRDPEVRYHAPRLGIPVFNSLRRAQRAAWRLPRRFRKTQTEEHSAALSRAREALRERLDSEKIQAFKQKPSARPPLHPLIRLFLFTLGVVAFLSIAAVLYPRAEVFLTPENQMQEITIVVQASPETKEVHISGNLPAHLVSVVVEGRDSLPTSGSVLFADSPAIGHVTFNNLTDQPVMVAKGTVVRGNTPQVLRFSVTQPGEVPPSPTGIQSLPVRCLTPGSAGNLPENSITAIEGLLGTQLSVTNPQPTRHGSDLLLPAPTEEDRVQLSKRLHQSLLESARIELESSLSSGDILLIDSLRLKLVLDESFQPDDDQPADRLNLLLRVEYQALMVSNDDLRSLASIALDATLPNGYASVDETIEISHLSSPTLHDDIASWKMTANRPIKARLEEPYAIRLSLGMIPSQAASRLAASLPLAEPPLIILVPDWWPRLPILPFRIMIRQ